MPGPFPPEKDLDQGDTVAAMVLRPEHMRTGVMLLHTFEQIIRQYGKPADLVILALPFGKGQEFVDGMMESMESTTEGT